MGEVKRPWISTQPLGLAYVAAAVRDAGFEVKMIDAYSLGTSGADLRQRTSRLTEPQIVGISTLTPQWADAVQVAMIAKMVIQRYPDGRRRPACDRSAGRGRGASGRRRRA